MTHPIILYMIKINIQKHKSSIYNINTTKIKYKEAKINTKKDQKLAALQNHNVSLNATIRTKTC